MPQKSVSNTKYLAAAAVFLGSGRLLLAASLRKTLWLIPVLLVFTTIGGTNARADSLVESAIGGTEYISAIDGITILGTTYNVTFTNTANPLITFTNSSNAATADNDLVSALNGLATDPNAILPTSSLGTTTFYVPYSQSAGTVNAAIGTCSYVVPCVPPYAYANAGDISLSVSSVYAEFSPVATPEPGIFSLMLIGFGVLGLMMIMGRRSLSFPGPH